MILLTCVCVCVLSSHLFWMSCLACGRTSRGHTAERSHRISHPPSFCGAARRIQPFLSLVDRKVEFWCTNDIIIVLHLLGIYILIYTVYIYIYIYMFLVRKSSSSCDCTRIRTHVPTSEGFEVTNCTTGAAGASMRFCISHYYNVFKIVAS